MRTPTPPPTRELTNEPTANAQALAREHEICRSRLRVSESSAR